MRTIVVAVVDTAPGRMAVDLAKADAEATGARLVLVAATAVTGHLVKDVESGRRHLAEVEKMLLDQGIDCVAQWSVGESLADATLRAAEEYQADLITIGLRQRTPVGKALLGGYEQEVLLNAPCPVLSVPARVGGGGHP